MKSINLMSLYQGHNSLPPSEFKSFTKHYEIEINDNELADIKVLVNEMFSLLPFINIFNEFYVGYKIQHISKEFDLLRFGSNHIINIEIKNTSTEDKIKKQLIRNKYYLSHINKCYPQLLLYRHKQHIISIESLW